MPLKDPEARKRYNREYRLAHLEQYKERDRKYRETHAEEQYDRMKRWVENNRERHRLNVSKANRTWRAKNRKRFADIIEEYHEKFPERRIAKSAVYYAVRHGKLIRPDHCVLCGRKCKPHAHHDDYSKPLEIVWLCSPCHKVADKKRALLEQPTR